MQIRLHFFLHFILASLALSAASLCAEIHLSISEGPALPRAIAGHAGGVVEGLPVVVGGSGWTKDKSAKEWSRDCFVLRDNQWVAGPELPIELSDAAYAWDHSGLYIAGGDHHKTASDKVFFLNHLAADSQWRSLSPLPEAIEACSGAISGHTFYVVGGYSNGEASDHLWSLDLSLPDAKWKARAQFVGKVRGYSALVASNGALYLFGGFNSPPYQKTVDIFRDAFRYGIATDNWSPVAGFDLAGYGWTATAIGASHILLTGRVPALSKTSSDIWLVNLETGHSTRIGDLIMKVCCMPVIPVGGNRWCVPGGEPSADRVRSNRTSIITLSAVDDRD